MPVTAGPRGATYTMKNQTISRGEALRRFMEQTGMTYEGVNRAGITMEKCDCQLSVCNGWIARNAWQDTDGKTRSEVA